MEAAEDDCTIDDGTAWLIAGWTCDACTLRNEPTATRCAACDRLRKNPNSSYGRNSSGVVVVLPPDQYDPIVKKRRLQKDTSSEEAKRTSTSDLVSSATHVFSEPVKDDDSWVCAACTLLNAEDDTRCAACNSVRWALPGRSVAAAALRKASQKKRPDHEETDSGIRREVGPDGTWSALPPAPEGHLERSCAADDALDIFADVALGGEEVGQIEGESVESTEMQGLDSVARPQWGAGDSPLFPSLNAHSKNELDDCNIEFGDAVVRLSSMGFDRTKCHLALEAANGDERLAHDFLIREV